MEFVVMPKDEFENLLLRLRRDIVGDLKRLDKEPKNKREACRLMGIGLSKLNQLMKDGTIKYQKKGGRVTIPQEEIDQYNDNTLIQ